MNASVDAAQKSSSSRSGNTKQQRKQSWMQKCIHAAAFAGEKGDHKTRASDRSGIFDISAFPFLKVVLSKKDILRRETEVLLQNEQAIPTFQELVQLPEQERRTKEHKDWKNLMLFLYGRKFSDNCRTCPGITKILEEDIPGLQTALISVLHPGTHIKTHVGQKDGMLRLHVPLIIPEGGKCALKVEERVLNWAEHEAIVFNHSKKHSAWNNSDNIRVILVVDFFPELAFPWSAVMKLAVFALTRTADFKAIIDRVGQAGLRAKLPANLA